MKRITTGAAFVIACATAMTPLAGALASGQDTSAKSAVAVAPAERQGLVDAATADAAELVKAVGLSADNTFTVTSVLKDKDGATHVHVDRAFKGMPVVGGDLVIHRDAAGNVTGHDGMFDGAITVDQTPTLNAAAGSNAGLAAAKEFKADYDATLVQAAVAQNNLVIFVDENGKQTLAYQVQTNGLTDDNTPSRVKTYVDADSGAPVRSWDEVQQAADPSLDATGTGNGIFTGRTQLEVNQTGSGYELRNTKTGNYATDSGNRKVDGTIFTSPTSTFGNGSNSDRRSAGADANFGADKTFEFYKTVLGRNGIWDTGRGARSRVHYDTNYTNAFWDGQQMTYGDGANDQHPLTEIDVSAHEMSHGVNANSARLIYSGDAGGLNEANSDIFGTAVEWYANLASDKPDYYIGELINLRGDGKPLRYMDEPYKDNRSPNCWSSSLAGMDPHLSSGPLNHWFYLASEGSGSKTINGVSYKSPTCNSSTVVGAGHENIEKVWYRTLTTKLTSTSNYKAAREGAIKSAIELYGASSQVCKSIESAFSAINVAPGSAKCDGGTPVPPPTTSKPPVPSTTAPVPPTSDPVPPTDNPPAPQPGGGLVNGGFEQGQTGWTGNDGPITDNSGRPAHSGSWKMWLGGNGARATETESQTFTVPSGAPKLSYYLAVDTDEKSIYMGFDKTVVTVNGTQVASYSNQDRGYGFKLRTVDLSRWAGQQVTLKFTMNEDSMNQTSFVFDDMSVR